MITVLGLMTCFNRKEKTVKAIENLIKGNPGIEFSFIVADDASTDGTGAALKQFSNTVVLEGDGNLYYSGGMRLAIQCAKECGKDYDYCLLFNDDVEFFDAAIEKLSSKEESVIWVGPTCDENGKLSYGGIVKTSSWRPKTEIVMADSEEGLLCDTFNANCVLIPWEIFKKLENIDECYTHSMGDFDYGFEAGKKGYKIKVSNEFVGECSDNPVSNTWRNREISIKERVRRKETPKGLPTKEWYYYLKKNYHVLTAVIYTVIPYIRIFLKR